MSEKQSDAVNHPKYYNQYVGFEVIDICKQLRDPDGGGNYFRGNVFKYIARAGWKQVGDPTPRERILKELQDVKQAEFYIKQEIKRIQEKLAALDVTTVADDLYNTIFPAVDRASAEEGEVVAPKQKTATTRYYCPDSNCTYAFTMSGIREKPEYCKNGHGSLQRTLNVG